MPEINGAEVVERFYDKLPSFGKLDVNDADMMLHPLGDLVIY